MNILFLSHLSGAPYAGPTYSVPNQIEAQSKIDNVFWYNACISEKNEWNNLPYYHDIREYPEESIFALPEPFNKPDFVIVELFYNMTKSKLRKELVQSDIPYVIIPRCELTKQGQARKHLKKVVANFLICKRFAQKASAIQYLTRQELLDSGERWNKKAFVLPNGINPPCLGKKSFSTDGIRCVSIGRIEPYQKGLDLLISACEMIKNELKAANVSIELYGPNKENSKSELLSSVTEKGLEHIISFRDGVYGEEKEKVLLSSDVFMIPSRFEGHPMALIEALSYGLPCIATTGSNMRDEVDSYDAGWTADNNAESIAEALRKMINDFECVSKKSLNAIRLSKVYQWSNIAKETNHVLQELQ